MPKTLAGPKGSSRHLKLWAGAPCSCCKCQCKHLCHLHFSNGSLNSILFLLRFRDSADRVVSENGQYEELIASSHEIAASTAQLVAASKVDR